MSEHHPPLAETLWRIAERVERLPGMAETLGDLETRVALLEAAVARLEKGKGHAWELARIIAGGVVGGLLLALVKGWTGV